MVAGKASEKLGINIGEEQELMMNISDMIIDTYMLESALLKTEKLTSKEGPIKNQERISMCINFSS